ncbi:MAG TPA: DUF2357 domain-containing protein [Thermoanaerobaculia bacterium]|nr:DUF2357 domain-containing protein [Thermoanaerobaculia bacterium]
MRELFRIVTDRVALEWGLAREKEVTPLAGSEPPPGLLDIRLRRGANVIEIRREEVPARAAADPKERIGPRLFEETDYKVLIEGAAPRVEHDDPQLVANLSPNRGGTSLYGVINFGSQIGRSTFRVYAGDELELELTIEVFPTKLDYENDYYEMLADAQNFVTGLAFRYVGATYRSVGTGRVAKQANVEWLAILRHEVGGLDRAMRRIARHPSRSIERDAVAVRPHRVRRPDTSVRRSLRRAAADDDQRTIEQRLPHPSLNTPEHRWLRAQLVGIRQRLTALYDVESKRRDGRTKPRVLDDLRSFEQTVARLLQLEPMREAEGEPPAGFGSLQLLKVPGYREAYGACMRLTMGLRVDAEALRVSVKELSSLYEYWCFFAILRAIAQLTGEEVPPEDVVQRTERGLHVGIRRGKERTVVFGRNRARRISATYAPNWTTSLIDQRPDFLISIEEDGWPIARLVIDAKYRVDASREYVQRHGAPGPPADALNVLHRYRDAILDPSPDEQSLKRSVIEAAALFPLRDRTDGEFERTALWQSFNRLGIGAIPLLPNGEQYLDQWLGSMLRRSGWELADRATPHHTAEQLWQWRELATQPVLIGTLRTKDEQRHLDWIRERRLYYTPRTRQRRLFQTKRVALYSSAETEPIGRVRFWADVKTVDVVRRGDIDTPWPADDPDAEQILYELDDLRDGYDIVNEAGDRMSTNRWSSRLGLRRARVLRELALETEPEWRVYEHLRVIDKAFRLTPMRATAAVERGRAMFVVGELRIRHTGGDRFRVSMPGEAPQELKLDELLVWLG